MSVAIHGVLLVAIWEVLQFPQLIPDLFTAPRQPVPERVAYVVVLAPAPPLTNLPRTGVAVLPARQAVAPSAAPRPATPARPTPEPLVPPAEVPSGLPPAPAPAVRGPTSGPLVGGQGAVRGVQPGYSEPRIWVEPTIASAPPLTGDAKLDSAVAARINAYRDSVLASTYAPNRFERGDWTVETKDGKKYGIDQQFIRLGRFSIPTALLGLLPLNQVQGNPIAFERERRLAAIRTDILEHAQIAMNEEEFRRAVKAIRDRKEKERKALLEKKKKEETRVISSGERPPSR
ncbi:MAG: hypothetical protein ACT4OZ_08640 [Gemmatimonadota bacterium]